MSEGLPAFLSVCDSEIHEQCSGASGMSGEIGCLLMGLSVVPISSRLRRSTSSRDQLGFGREPSPRERIRATHSGSLSPQHRHHGYVMSVDDEMDCTEQHQMLDHLDGSYNVGEVDACSRQTTAQAGLVPESHSKETSSFADANAPATLEGVAQKIAFQVDYHNFRT